MIQPPSKRGPRLTFVAALLGAIVIAVASVFWSQAQTAKMLSEKMQPHEMPVPSDGELRRQLTQEQYHVTRENGTETAFRNSYWNNYRPGIYVDLITNEPLFSSVDKYDSGTGWPSFTKPIGPNHVVLKSDHSYNMVRTELRAQKSDSHLGHVFDDGPPPANLRYSVNSAAIRFVPVEKLKSEGFAEYLSLFEQAKGDAPDSPGA
jgi:methionine-R-sulfoxide reductase